MRKGVFLRIMVSTALIGLAGCDLMVTEQLLRDLGLSPLTQSELEALFSRTRTVRRNTLAGASITSTYMQNGTFKSDSPQGPYDGSWRINGGQLCTQSPARAHGAEHCVTLYKTGNNAYKSFRADGTFTATRSFTN